MKLNFRNLSLRDKVIGIFIIIFIFVPINFIFLGTQKNKGRHLSRAIDIAGKNRMLSQRIALLAMQVENGNEEVREVLKELVEEHDTVIAIFHKGGRLPSAEYYIPPVAKELQDHLKTLDKIWKPFKQQALSILKEPIFVDSTVIVSKELPPIDSTGTVSYTTEEKIVSVKNKKIMQSVDYLRSNSTPLLEANNMIVQDLIAESMQLQSSYTWLNRILLLLSISALILLYMLTRKIILSPLEHIGKITAKIARRDFSTKISYDQNDEIGKISGAINQLINNINYSAEFVRNIGEGNLDEEYKGLENEEDYDKNTLAGALINMRTKMKEVAQEDKERNWVTEGLAKFVDILRANNDDVEALGNQIISNLVKYTDSNQGGLFILNEENDGDKYIELVACYAYSRKKFLMNKIQLGEGLIGQTFIEKKTTLLVNVPEEYVNIKSGLGNSNPRNILLVPLKVNEEILGVIELASFSEFQPYQVQFVEKLGESIASTIAGVRTNEKTRRLLQDSQMLTEQMKAQEEEMRQNMEELSATQEEMSRKEREMTEQFGAINNAFATMELSMEGNIQKCNSNFAVALGYSEDDLRGKSMSSILDVGEGEETAESYAESLWEGLRAGNPITGDFVYTSQENKKVWFHATFYPIKDTSGEPHKILVFAEDITGFKISMTSSSKAQPVDRGDDDSIEKLEQTLSLHMDSIETTQKVLGERLRAYSEAGVVLETTPEGIITFANEQFRNVSQYNEEVYSGKHYLEFIAVTEEEVNAMNAAITAQTPFHGDSVKLNTQEGSDQDFKMILYPIGNEDNVLIKLLIVLFETGKD